MMARFLIDKKEIRVHQGKSFITMRMLLYFFAGLFLMVRIHFRFAFSMAMNGFKN